jgi:hypothetical protein
MMGDEGGWVGVSAREEVDKTRKQAQKLTIGVVTLLLAGRPVAMPTLCAAVKG